MEYVHSPIATRWFTCVRAHTSTILGGAVSQVRMHTAIVTSRLFLYDILRKIDTLK